MMKTVFCASLLATAAAFAPAQTKSSITALSGALDDMPGAIDWRCGEKKFDPLKLSETYAPLVPFFREAELKHGRTAMLAVLGWIVADLGIRFPGETYSVANVPSSHDAHDLLLTGPMVFGLMCVGLFDLTATGPGISATFRGERDPGDFGWYRYKPKDPEAYKASVNKELLNGRLAMIAIGGIATQSEITGHGFPYI